MSSGADAVDQAISLSLKGIEVMARISGEGAKNLATYLYAVLTDQKKTRGKIRLEGLLRSGKELKVFAFRNEDLQKFTREAKRYGVLYCALRDKKDTDGMCDIMVRAEDAAKINRIVERFKLATVDTASIKSEIEKSRTAQQEEKAPSEKETPAEKSADDFLDELLAKPDQPEPDQERTDNPNSTTDPTAAKAEKSPPSEPTYERSGKAAGGTSEPERKSVRQELKEIREAHREQTKPKREATKEQAKSAMPPAKSGRHKSKAKSKPKER
ncbi:Protein of unknown function [Desulfotomaculum arcticum]|uniref:DUF3801 domain-containing protein n=1 Tax=Desulfotruncus arcticus DSM 17038 TaxID=1121424 RepID=A0A1I2YZY3_9FIRM|nr:PcfB family protein [Desulfotruncus arcticus]SFH31143.1 Protein of unknown function [Desulfotomaculum arcticum] [Desulfotruncus arcticus DSM 17038]